MLTFLQCKWIDFKFSPTSERKNTQEPVKLEIVNMKEMGGLMFYITEAKCFKRVNDLIEDNNNDLQAIVVTPVPHCTTSEYSKLTLNFKNSCSLTTIGESEPVQDFIATIQGIRSGSLDTTVFPVKDTNSKRKGNLISPNKLVSNCANGENGFSTRKLFPPTVKSSLARRQIESAHTTMPNNKKVNIGDQLRHSCEESARKRPRVSKFFESAVEVGKRVFRSFDSPMAVSRYQTPLKFMTSPAAAPRGLKNLGNTCYLNSALAALMGMDPFMSDLTFISKSPVVAPLSRKSSLFWSLLQLYDESKKKAYDAVNTESIKSVIAKISKQFERFDQQDSHDVLNCILDSLQEELYPLLKDNNAIPIWTNFAFHVRRSLECSCGNRRSRKELYFSLSLEMDDDDENRNIPSVVDLLQRAFQKSELEVNCEKCDSKKATSQYKFANFPKVLVLHLKRFKYNEDGTLSKLVFPIRIEEKISVSTVASSRCAPCLSMNKEKWKVEAAESSSSSSKKEEAAVAVVVRNEDPIADDMTKAIELSIMEQKQQEAEDDELQRAIRESLMEVDNDPKDVIQEEDDDEDEEVEEKSSDDNDDEDFDSDRNSTLESEWEDRMSTVMENSRYQLRATSVHLGESANSGHYISDVWSSKEKKWFRHNDSRVTTIDIAHAKNQWATDAYILFYENVA